MSFSQEVPDAKGDDVVREDSQKRDERSAVEDAKAFFLVNFSEGIAVVIRTSAFLEKNIVIYNTRTVQ